MASFLNNPRTLYFGHPSHMETIIAPNYGLNLGFGSHRMSLNVPQSLKLFVHSATHVYSLPGFTPRLLFSHFLSFLLPSLDKDFACVLNSNGLSTLIVASFSLKVDPLLFIVLGYRTLKKILVLGQLLHNLQFLLTIVLTPETTL